MKEVGVGRLYIRKSGMVECGGGWWWDEGGIGGLCTGLSPLVPLLYLWHLR